VQHFFDAVSTFFHHLAAVGWGSLGIALSIQVARLLCRTVAWRNIVAAAYPAGRVRLRTITGAYLAGVGVNAIVPARGGDFLKMYLVKHRVEGTAYPTLASTLIVETLLDTVVAACFLVWALTLGVLPGLDVLPHVPAVDWAWPLRHPNITAAIFITLVCIATFVSIRASRRTDSLRQRFGQGFAILRSPSRYLTQVVTWQAASWALRIASIYWFLRAFEVPATIHNALLVIVVQSLSTLFPFTPGGAGTQQGLLVYVFRRSPISKTSILSFSVGMNIATVVLSVLIGFGAIFVMLRTFRWRKVTLPEEKLAGR
jgi:uncharacterized protein (TIRG00374 family)